MIEAWFSSSDSTRTAGPASTLRAPRLAAKPVGKQTAASVPFQAANATSNSVCTGRDPVTSRDAPAPAPQRSSAPHAAATTVAVRAQPQVVVGGEGDHRCPVERAHRPAGVELAGARQRPSLTTASRRARIIAGQTRAAPARVGPSPRVMP